MLLDLIFMLDKSTDESYFAQTEGKQNRER